MISALWPLTCHIWRRTSKQAPVAAGTCLLGGRMRRLCATHGFSDFRGDRSSRNGPSYAPVNMFHSPSMVEAQGAWLLLVSAPRDVAT